MFSYAPSRKKRGNEGHAKGLDKEIITAGKREFDLYMHSSFHFKRQRSPMLTMLQLPSAGLAVPGKQQAGLRRCHACSSSEDKAISVLSDCTDLSLAITTLVFSKGGSLNLSNSPGSDTSLFPPPSAT